MNTRRNCPTCGRLPAEDGHCYRHFPEHRAPRNPAILFPRAQYLNTHCVACGLELDTDPRLPAEYVCRNPACRKYVAPAAALPDVRVVEMPPEGPAIPIAGVSRA